MSIKILAPTFACAVSVLCAHQAHAETGMAFFDDSSVTGKARTVYYRADNKHAISSERNNPKGAWTAALWLNLESGPLYDLFSFGASGYGVAKLDTLNGSPDGSKGLLKSGNKGFSKLGQLWADMQFGSSETDLYGHVKVGQQTIATGLVCGSSSRSVPTTYQGVNVESDIYGTTFKVAWIDEVNYRNDDKFRKLMNKSNQRIDHVLAAELAHSFSLAQDGDLTLSYRNGFAKDFVKAHNLGIRWDMPVHQDMNVSLRGQVYHAKEDGTLWSGSFDKDATLYSFTADASQGPWTITAAVTTTDAEHQYDSSKDYAVPGSYYDNLASNVHGVFDAQTSAIYSSFHYDNELAWKLGAAVDMTDYGVPGLNLKYAYFHGDGIEVRVNGIKKESSENEHDFTAEYAFADALKGLKFKFQYARYRSDTALRMATGVEQDEIRAWLDYDFVLF